MSFLWARSSRKEGLNLGLFLVASFLLGMGTGAFSMSLTAVLCGAALSTSMMSPAVLAAGTDRGTRGKVLGLYRFVTDTAYIFGPVTLGFLAEHHGYRAAGMAFAGVVAVLFLLVILRLPRLSMRPG